MTRELLEQRRWEHAAVLLERHCVDPLIHEGATVLPLAFGGGLLIINSALHRAWHFTTHGERVACTIMEPDEVRVFDYDENVFSFYVPLEELVRSIARLVGIFWEL